MMTARGDDVSGIRASSSELIWATDVHLDHLPHAEWHEFGLVMRHEHPGSRGLILTGDIGDAPRVCDILEIVQSAYAGPLYFVLGNHDYYRGSFKKVDRRVRRLCEQVSDLIWLRDDIVSLGEGRFLVGTDGWYDARFGDPQSELQMSDFTLIEELFAAQDESRQSLLEILRYKADEFAESLHHQISRALEKGAAREIIVATHVPPFVEAAHYKGAPPNDTWAPFFTSKATGEVLRKAALKNPEVQFRVLCGHTHGQYSYDELPNLSVATGAAEYGNPRAAGFLLNAGEPKSQLHFQEAALKSATP